MDWLRGAYLERQSTDRAFEIAAAAALAEEGQEGRQAAGVFEQIADRDGFTIPSAPAGQMMGETVVERQTTLGDRAE